MQNSPFVPWLVELLANRENAADAMMRAFQVYDQADSAFRNGAGCGVLGVMQDPADAARGMSVNVATDITFARCSNDLHASGRYAHFYKKFGFCSWDNTQQCKDELIGRAQSVFPPELKLAMQLGLVHRLEAKVHQFVCDGNDWRAACCGGGKNGVEMHVVLTTGDRIEVLRPAETRLDMDNITKLTRAWGTDVDCTRACTKVVCSPHELGARLSDVIRAVQAPAREELMPRVRAL